MIKVWGVKLTYALKESDAPARYRRGNQRSSCQTESFLLFEKIIPGRLTGEERGVRWGLAVKPVDETQPNWGRWGEGRAGREGKNKTGGRRWDALLHSLGVCGGHLFLCHLSYTDCHLSYTDLSYTDCLRHKTCLQKMIRFSICCVCSDLSCLNKRFKHSSSIMSNLHQDSTPASWCVWWLNSKKKVCVFEHCCWSTDNDSKMNNSWWE